MYSQSLIHTRSEPRSVTSLMAVCSHTDLNGEEGKKNPKYMMEKKAPHSQQKNTEREDDRKISVSRGRK